MNCSRCEINISGVCYKIKRKNGIILKHYKNLCKSCLDVMCNFEARV